MKRKKDSDSLMRFLSSPILTVVLLILFAAGMAAATFIENSTSSIMAYTFVYGAKWFELLLLFLVVNLLSQMVEHKLFHREKLPSAILHISFVIIVLGAAVTRYTGEEGTIHIRKGETVDSYHYGTIRCGLPFSLRLDNFIMDTYPGSDNPSGYKSEVSLFDSERGKEMQYSIFMNNVLKYRGYRFYQSSFDEDGEGSVLAVSHDPAGMAITYSGYLLLFVAVIMLLFGKNTRFRKVKPENWKSNLRKYSSIIILFFVVCTQSLEAQIYIPDKTGSDQFGEVLVQDKNGRTKPLYTLSSDILRKVAKANRLGNYSSMQVFLGLCFDFEHWKDIPMIHVGNTELRKQLGMTDKLASFNDFFDSDGSYKLAGLTNKVYKKSAGARNKYDKEILKADEKVNIIFMAGESEFLRILPVDDGSHTWVSPQKVVEMSIDREKSLFAMKIAADLFSTLETNDADKVEKLVETIRDYQESNAGYRLPSLLKAKAEVLYDKAGLFEKLFPVYFVLGILMLLFLLVDIIRGNKVSLSIAGILGLILFVCFVFHTLGLGLRWYISGHSPLSNGYETMIFISWVSLIAGFVFGKRSMLTLAATAVLSGAALMVAHLSFMDPQITNLVPVLQSFWLTLHVSVITAGYCFLGLGALLGMINLILMTVSSRKNMDGISRTVDELTVINYKTLVLGLYFLVLGTFLGAVWANEAWGRYWGWDPKETWALISIVVYVLVTHSHMIPALRNVFAFNVLSVFAISAVLMTFFGVNYFFSGLHSYAGGEAISMPYFVYIVVLLLIALTTAAYLKYRKQ